MSCDPKPTPPEGTADKGGTISYRDWLKSHFPSTIPEAKLMAMQKRAERLEWFRLAVVLGCFALLSWRNHAEIVNVREDGAIRIGQLEENERAALSMFDRRQERIARVEAEQAVQAKQIRQLNAKVGIEDRQQQLRRMEREMISLTALAIDHPLEFFEARQALNERMVHLVEE